MKNILKKIGSVVLAIGMAFSVTACSEGSGDGASNSDAPAAEITVAFENETLTMQEWETKKIVAIASDASPVIFTVSDASILYLRGTNITALKAGTTTVTAASVNDPSATAELTVTVTENAESRPELSISGDANLAIGKTGEYVATLSNVNPADYMVTYAVSDETLATIDANTGELTALAAGKVTIKASVTYRSVSFEAEFEVDIAQEVRVLFGEEDAEASFNVSQVSEAIEGEYTVEIGGKTYAADAEGNVALVKSDFEGAESNVYESKITNGDTVYEFKLIIFFGTAATIYQNGVALVKNADGYYAVDTTQAADEQGLRWLTFDPAADRAELGYNYLRLTVKWSDFGTLDASVVTTNLSGYNYHYTFGYRYNSDVNGYCWTFWDNDYVGQAYAGAIDASGDCHGYAFLKVYNANGGLIMDYNAYSWSAYVPALQLNTEYIIEICTAETGDLEFSGLDGAVITDIKWAESSLS